VALIAGCTWLAIAFQFYLSLRFGLSNGQSLTFIVFRITNYFTILSNLLVATVLTSIVVNRFTGGWRFFCRPGVQAAAVIYITMVSAVYALVLTRHVHPTGVYKLASSLLHDVTPLLYVVYWLIFAPKGRLHWKDSLLWLIFPIAYGVYVLARGAWTSFYPYPFVNVTQLGYAHVLRNTLVLLAIIWALGLLLVAFDWLLGRLFARRREPALVPVEEAA
jgi:hypothetical protein